MKVRLPYFFLALLSGCYFFPGMVQAKMCTEGGKKLSQDRIIPLFKKLQGNKSLCPPSFYIPGGIRLTYKSRGSEENYSAVNPVPVGRATCAISIFYIHGSANQLLSLSVTGSNRIGTFTQSAAAHLSRMQIHSFFDSFL